jgi:hypothetical protein
MLGVGASTSRAIGLTKTGIGRDLANLDMPLFASHTPSRVISISLSTSTAARRKVISGWYSGELYQVSSAFMSGNSMSATLSGCQWVFSKTL